MPITDEHLLESVERHMRRDFSVLAADQTVGEALAAMRAQPPAERIIYFYVVDSQRRLQGVVPTRRLLFSPLERSIADVMIRDVIVIPSRATLMDACEFFTLHRLLAFPVVDDDRRIVGVIDVELYTDEMIEYGVARDVDNLFQLIGVHATGSAHFRPIEGFKSRFPWLLCNISAGIAAAFLSGLFEAELQRTVALALFIPVVLALAESVSIQSVSLALQVMAGKPLTFRSLLDSLSKEARTGLLLGGGCGLLVAMVALLWLQRPAVAGCILGGVVGGVISAAVAGAAVPQILRLIQRNPNLAAGPIALAVADMATLLIYFNLARFVLPA
jgi:magnesium transporter